MALCDFKNNSFSLNFPISRENRYLETITIRYDVQTHYKRYELATKHDLYETFVSNIGNLEFFISVSNMAYGQGILLNLRLNA